MGTAMVQLNTRIDPMLKAGGDAVLTRNGLGPSDAIRALWAYLVEHQALPGFMVADKREVSRAKSLAEQGCGLAFSSLGLSASDFAPAESLSLIHIYQPLSRSGETGKENYGEQPYSGHCCPHLRAQRALPAHAGQNQQGHLRSLHPVP